MIDTASEGVHVSRSIWYFSVTKDVGMDGESIDDDERPGRPMEIGDVMIEDTKSYITFNHKITSL